MRGSLGRYELLAPLGTGGSGEVWEAVLRGRMGFRKPVAVKWVRTDQGFTDDRDVDLIREARMGARLSHPNVVATYELSEAEGKRFIAMELVKGPTVFDLYRGRRLNGRMVVEIGLQTASGLSHIHEQNVGQQSALVHRDIKPANLLVDRGGVVKIADFGIARLTRQQHGTLSIAGTPGFMAPEQAFGTEDPRADLFALGCTLYLLTTGKHPYGVGRDALRSLQLIDAITSAEGYFEPVERFLPGLADILRRCLRCNPEERFATARELSKALRACMPVEPMPGLEFSARAADPTAGIPLDAPTHSAPDQRGRVLPLVGRDFELSALLRHVESGVSVLVLWGPSGAGKTRLALQLLDVLRERRVVQVYLRGASTDEDLLARVAEALDCAPDDVDAAMVELGDALVLLDGMGDLPDDRRVSRWSACSGSTFVVTSRRRRQVAGQALVRLAGLTPEAALELFDLAARQADPDPVDALAVVHALDYLPGNVQLAAERLRYVDLAVLAEGIAGGLGVRATDRSGQPGLWDGFERTWAQLSPNEQAVWAQFSVFEDGAPAAAVSAVCRCSGEVWIEEVVDALVEQSLLTFDPEHERFECLRSHRAFARTKLGAQSEVRVRHAAWFATSDLDPTFETANLLSAWRRSASEPLAKARLTEALAPNLLGHGPLADLLALFPQPPTDKRLVRVYSVAMARAGKASGAKVRPSDREPWQTHLFCERALAMDAVAELRGVRGTLGEHWREVHLEALLAARTGNLRRALDRAQQAVAWASATHDEEGMAVTRATRGQVLLRLGEGAAALRDVERAYESARLRGDVWLAIQTQTLVASVLLQLGESTRALREARFAVDTAGRYGAPLVFEDASLTLCEALIHHDPSSAASWLEGRSPVVARGVRGARFLEVRGRVSHALGDGTAVRLLERASTLAEVLGYCPPEVLESLAIVRLELGLLDKAEEALRRALRVQESWGNPDALARLYAGLALVSHRRGEDGKKLLARAEHAAARAKLSAGSPTSEALAKARTALRS